MKYRLTIFIALLLSTIAYGQKKPATAKPAPAPFSSAGKTVSVYTTADSTDLRLDLTDNLTFVPTGQPVESEISIFVNPARTYQTFLGIGGAITDASAEVFAKLPPAKQKQLLDSYYDRNNGIGYTLARTNIHSCDFSSGSYTYVSTPDKDLHTFNIDHDRQYRIPLIKRATEAAGGKLTMFVSPWSPPEFMKSNGEMLHGGTLLPEYRQAWADYFVRFIKAYEKEGIPIWGLTIQNEPMATQTWESCIFTAENERDFLKSFLGPTLQKQGLGAKKIIVWDHNRDLINYRANVIFADPVAAKYAWGIGFHWYETWAGGQMMHDNVDQVHKDFPDKNLMFTEGCAESFNPERYFAWALGERYGSSMIQDFNNGTVGWTDWNILLDEKGGPNHVGNFCFAPIHADTKAGELIYTSSYFYIGHFSKFIRPGAKRVSAVSSRSHLLTTSFLNADGKMATVVMNPGNQAITYNFYVGTNAVKVKIPAHAIQTLVY